MSVSTPSKGTHFSDGVRTGPIIGSSFVAGANVLTPSVMVSSPVDQTPPGVFNTPLSLHNTIPAPTSTTNIATAQTLAAVGYVALATISAIGINVMTYNSIPNVIQLDTPRNIQIQGAVGTTLSIFLVFGWDEYGMPLTEQITGPVGNVKVIGNKAFKYIQAIHSSAGTTANISIGSGNIFGLPYLVTGGNYIFSPSWGGIPDASWFVRLPNNSLSTTITTPTITVAVTSSAGLAVGQFVTISGSTAIGGIAASEINITAQIATIPDGTHFTYASAGIATATIAGGGGANVSASTFVPGEQSIATATTGDVRGTYTSSAMGGGPLFLADGASRLTINAYSASGDGRSYNNATVGTFYLNNNPLFSTNLSPTVAVFAPNHQLTSGENVTIAGATTFGGLAAGALNIGPVPVTVTDQNFFTYTATANATSSAQGGGVGVTMTPGRGNLYQTVTGRFGVAQYNLSPLPTP